MVDAVPEFEITDIEGEVLTFSGTLPNPPATDTFPAVAGNFITEFEVVNVSSQAGREIELSLDGGTTFNKTIPGNGGSFSWSPKKLQQIVIRASSNQPHAYEIVINRGEI